MAKSDSKGDGDLGKQRPPVQSSLPAGKRATTAAESHRGDTAASGSGGPTELPAQFGPYRIKKKLGGGGMGTVYLVENTDLEREEALKVPHFGDGADPQLRERFLREARSAAKLDHANLCPIYAVGVLDGIYYLTMRFLKGRLLSDYTGQPQPARKAVEIVTKLAQALEAAHAQGVIHRDLKPSNVIMVGGVGPVVMDFGLAKQVKQPDKKLTQMGSMLGTPSYMPPEQVKGDLERMGPPSDVYSLGVILYELLTGRLPFEGSMASIFGQILYTEAPLPSALVPGLNPTLDGICRKAMAKEPTDRYPTMKAFAAGLIDYLRSTPATDGAGNLVPTVVDIAPRLQVPTAGPGARPAGKAAVFQAATVAPEPPAAATASPRVVKTMPVTPARLAPSRRLLQSPLPWVLGGCAVLLAGLVGVGILATILLRVETRAGTVMLEIDEQDAEVYVDGDKITIGRPGDKNTITVQAKEGKHRLRVTKEGFEAWTDDITFRENEPNRVKISLKRVAVAQNPPKDRKEPSPKDPAPPNEKESNPAARDPLALDLGPAQPKLPADLPKTSFLSDLAYVSAKYSNDWFATNGTVFGKKIVVEGKESPHGIFLHPDPKSFSEISYNLGRKWVTFRCGVAVPWSGPGKMASALTFEVLGDEDVLWASKPVGEVGKPQWCEVNVEKVTVLRLRVRCPGKAGYAQAVWLEPRVTNQGDPRIGALAADGFVPLFNGKDLTGWKTHPAQPGNWRVVNGILTETGSAGVSHLYTERDDYKDFHLRVEARSGAFTGVYFRNQFGPAHPPIRPIWLFGYNAKIDKNRLGGLIVDDAKNPLPIRSHVPFVPSGQWLTLEVLVERNHILLKIDGKTTADYTDTMNRFPSGHITLQQHSPTLVAEFRKIEIKELSASPPPRLPTEPAADAALQPGSADLFVKGSVWRGPSYQLRPFKAGPKLTEVIVKERNGDRFKGELSVNGVRLRAIEGTVVNGAIRWFGAAGEPKPGHHNIGVINGTRMEIRYYPTPNPTVEDGSISLQLVATNK